MNMCKISNHNIKFLGNCGLPFGGLCDESAKKPNKIQCLTPYYYKAKAFHFRLKIFNLWARRVGDVHFLIARLYITGLD